MLKPAIATSAAILMCILLAVQYPLQTTFPIGGDASSHINTTLELKSAFQKSPLAGLQKLTSSSYPLSSLIMLITHTLPGKWPEKFIWLSVTAQTAVAIMLGLAAKRIGGLPAMATAIATWGLTPTLLRHFTQGTIAQLISFIGIAIFFERLAAQRFIHAWLAIILTFLLHPLSGVVLLLTVALTLPVLYTNRQQLPKQVVIQLGIIVTGTIVAALSLLWWVRDQLPLLVKFVPTFPNFSFLKTLSGYFGPFVIIAPIGLIWIMKQARTHLLFTSALMMFSLLSTMLAFNHMLGIGVWTPRFAGYFIIAITLTAALGFPIALKSVLPSNLRPGIACAIFLITAGLAWQSGAKVYATFEDPSTYQRPHPYELEALSWAASNLPKESIIASTTESRHATWIPIITDLTWYILTNKESTLPINNTQERYSHLMFFTLREEIPSEFQNTARFPTIFSNQAVTLKAVH